MGDYGAEYFRGLVLVPGQLMNTLGERPLEALPSASRRLFLKSCSKHKTNDTALLQMGPQQCR